ncbi:MAG: UPF0280 family protein [Coriobacteriia bacterium]
MTYEPRTYRRTVQPEGLVAFEVSLKETDLQILAERDLSSEAADLIAQARWEIESFIAKHPRFAEALSPYDVPEDSPPLVRQMSAAGAKARVGPMAAVAGAIAQYVAMGLAEHSREVIVENGGDIYLVGEHDRTIALLAGDAPVSGKVGVRVASGLLPVAVCTSSGTVGHSLSFGEADAVTVIARDGALADAVATALANRVREPADAQHAVEAARGVLGVLGVLVVVGDTLAAWGNMRLVPLEAEDESGSPVAEESDEETNEG